MAIGSIVKTLVLDEVVLAFLSKEVRWKYFESTKEALVIHGILKEKGKKREKGRYKSHGRHKSLRNSKKICWNCGKIRHFRRDCEEEKKKIKKENNYFDDESKKSSQKDGYVFATTLATYVS